MADNTIILSKPVLSKPTGYSIYDLVNTPLVNKFKEDQFANLGTDLFGRTTSNGITADIYVDTLYTELLVQNRDKGMLYNIRDLDLSNQTNKELLEFAINYLRMRVCKKIIEGYINNTKMTNKFKMTLLKLTAISITNLIQFLEKQSNITVLQNAKILSSSGGKKRKQKGGMDTAKIYNAQGLVQELSALHQTDRVSPAVLFPSPFSASSLTASSGATDTLPPDTVAALMPPIPTPQAGGKKKVKSPKRK